MGKLVKVYDKTFNKGAQNDDIAFEGMRTLERISHKPTEEESEEVNGDVGDLSYYTIYDKKFRIVVYIEK